MKREFIPSVNFHIWESCNMRCRFCFATFQDVKHSILPFGHLPEEKAKKVVQELARAGFQKITFAGGEPTMCPWLPELIAIAKKEGLTTMIVTNGSRLTDAFLDKNRNHLDWIAISIDSLNPETNISIGRVAATNKPFTVDYYKSIVEKVKLKGFGLKINTVVNSQNHHEDMEEFIRFARPKRWKILQAMEVDGQNNGLFDDFKISEAAFQNFVSRHHGLKDITTLVPESTSQIIGSYIMVDPAGRFFDDTSGRHHYSRPILNIGVEEALKEVNYDFQKFQSRGGIYNWEIIKQ